MHADAAGWGAGRASHGAGRRREGAATSWSSRRCCSSNATSPLASPLSAATASRLAAARATTAQCASDPAWTVRVRLARLPSASGCCSARRSMPTRSCAVRVSAATLDEALPRRSVLSVFAMVLELPTVCEFARTRAPARPHPTSTLEPRGGGSIHGLPSLLIFIIFSYHFVLINATS